MLFSSCVAFPEEIEKSNTFKEITTHFSDSTIEVDGWRNYINPTTNYRFKYPAEYFYRDILLDLINLDEVQDENLKSLYELEKKDIENAEVDSFNTFYGNDDILLVAYTIKGDFKGKYAIIISPIGTELSFVFYHNNRRIRLKASKNFADIENINIYQYYNDLIEGTLPNTEVYVWKLFNQILDTLENEEMSD